MVDRNDFFSPTPTPPNEQTHLDRRSILRDARDVADKDPQQGTKSNSNLAS